MFFLKPLKLVSVWGSRDNSEKNEIHVYPDPYVSSFFSVSTAGLFLLAWTPVSGVAVCYARRGVVSLISAVCMPSISGAFPWSNRQVIVLFGFR